ncbi:MAG: NACHT domain-containing protein [Cyanobacteria bacterium J06643_5]
MPINKIGILTLGGVVNIENFNNYTITPKEDEPLNIKLRSNLIKIISEEVNSRLKQSLHNKVYIILNQQQDSSQVEIPWEMDVKVPNESKKRVLKNTEIITVFDEEDIGGKLLILGEPGSGKTTMLLKLAEKLVERAKEGSKQPVPVLFSLPTWKNDNQTIKDWLVEQLKEKYGVRKDISKQWVENQEIIPLLDGLDELATERQERCVRKINDFLKPENWTNPLVVCSRIQEYQNYQTLLQLNISLELYPYTPQQVYKYLLDTGNSELWNSISNDVNLSNLAQTPFLLNIILLAAKEISIEKWQQFQSNDERLSYLFDAYISRMFKSRYKGKQPQPEKTKRWLGWLAKRLIEEQSTEFLIEKMQPYWLKNKLKLWVLDFIRNAVNFGLGYGAIFGLFLGMVDLLIDKANLREISNVTNGVFNGVIFGIYFAIFMTFHRIFDYETKYKISAYKYFQFSFKRFIQTTFGFSFLLPTMLIACLGIFWLLYKISYFINYVTSAVTYWYAAGVFGLCMGIFNFWDFEIARLDKVTTNKKNNRQFITFLGYVVLFVFIVISLSIIAKGISWIYVEFCQIVNRVFITELYLIFEKISIVNLWIILAMIFGVINVIANIYFTKQEIENKRNKFKAIRHSSINTVILSIIAFLLITILKLFLRLVIGQDINKKILIDLFEGILLGLLIGINSGGLFIIQHSTLRIFLWSSGYIPWNYTEFLDYCTNRLFLQRVGGSYRFIHDFLRQHFAKKYTESSNANSPQFSNKRTKNLN